MVWIYPSLNYLSNFEIPVPVFFLAPLAPRAVFGAPLWKPRNHIIYHITVTFNHHTYPNSFWVSYSLLEKIIPSKSEFFYHVFSLSVWFSCLIALFRLLRLNTRSPCSQAWHCKIIRTVAWGVCGKRAWQCGSSAVQGQFSVIHNCVAITCIFKCIMRVNWRNIAHKELFALKIDIALSVFKQS